MGTLIDQVKTTLRNQFASLHLSAVSHLHRHTGDSVPLQRDMEKALSHLEVAYFYCMSAVDEHFTQMAIVTQKKLEEQKRQKEQIIEEEAEADAEAEPDSP